MTQSFKNVTSNLPRCNWTSFTSKVLDLRWRASWQAAVTTLSIKSSAICSSIWEENRDFENQTVNWRNHPFHYSLKTIIFSAVNSIRQVLIANDEKICKCYSIQRRSKKSCTIYLNYWQTSSTSSSSCSFGSISLTRSCSFFLLSTWEKKKMHPSSFNKS